MLNSTNLLLEDSVNSSGLVEKPTRPMSDVTNARRAEEVRIKSTGNTLDTVNQILLANIPILKIYVSHNGEAPLKTDAEIATQAAIIRANAIAYIAKAADCSDIEALLNLEDTESENKDIQNAEAEYMLPASVQAALKILIERMMGNTGGKANMYDALIKLDSSYGTPLYKLSAYNIIGSVTQSDPLFSQEHFKESVEAPYPESSANFFDGSNIIHFVDNLFQSVSTGINTTGQAVTGVKNKIQDALDKALSDATKQTIKDNLPMILLIIFVLALSIYFAVKYGNTKSK